MIEVLAEVGRVSGAMTLASARSLLEEGNRLIAAQVSIFDLAAVSEVDSSALAVVFGWLREAQQLGKALRILNFPESLSSLAEVYGVSDLLPVA